MQRVLQAQAHPAAHLNRHFPLSPVNALIDLVVRCGLCRQVREVPVRFDFDILIHQRITALPQRWPARGGYARGSGLQNMVIAPAVMMIPVVIGTNVFVAGLRCAGSALRTVLRLALGVSLQPLFGNALWTEYQDLLDPPVWSEATTADEWR